MKVKICSFEEAVKICKKNKLRYDPFHAFGIYDKWELWGENAEAYDDGKYYIAGHMSIPRCFAVEIDEPDEPNEFDIIHYGTIVTDDDIESKDGNFIRIRIIAYKGNIYYHKMANGDVVEFRRLVLL